MGHIVSAIKYGLFAVGVLFVGQMSIGGRTVNSRVGEVLARIHVRSALESISRKFDFKEGTASHAQTNPEDRSKLSGLLKKR